MYFGAVMPSFFNLDKNEELLGCYLLPTESVWVLLLAKHKPSGIPVTYNTEWIVCHYNVLTDSRYWGHYFDKPEKAILKFGEYVLDNRK